MDRLRSPEPVRPEGHDGPGNEDPGVGSERPTPIIPIYTYETYHTLEVAKEMYDRGVYVNPTLPPATPEGGLLRTSSWPPTRRPCWMRLWTLWRRCW